MTVRQLLASLDSAELADWMAYDRIDPFGQDRADLREAIPWAVYFNSRRNPNSDRVKPADLMWSRTPAVPEQTPEDVDAAIDAGLMPLVEKRG